MGHGREGDGTSKAGGRERQGGQRRARASDSERSRSGEVCKRVRVTRRDLGGRPQTTARPFQASAGDSDMAAQRDLRVTRLSIVYGSGGGTPQTTDTSTRATRRTDSEASKPRAGRAPSALAAGQGLGRRRRRSAARRPATPLRNNGRQRCAASRLGRNGGGICGRAGRCRRLVAGIHPADSDQRGGEGRCLGPCSIRPASRGETPSCRRLGRNDSDETTRMKRLG